MPPNVQGGQAFGSFGQRSPGLHFLPISRHSEHRGEQLASAWRSRATPSLEPAAARRGLRVEHAGQVYEWAGIEERLCSDAEGHLGVDSAVQLLKENISYYLGIPYEGMLLEDSFGVVSTDVDLERVLHSFDPKIHASASKCPIERCAHPGGDAELNLDAVQLSGGRKLIVEHEGYVYEWVDIEDLLPLGSVEAVVGMLQNNICLHFGIPADAQVLFARFGRVQTRDEFARWLKSDNPYLVICDSRLSDFEERLGDVLAAMAKNRARCERALAGSSFWEDESLDTKAQRSFVAKPYWV